jgi:sulfoxide reductase heme-binding subunit YedZ
MSPLRASYWTRRLARNVGILAVALVVHLVVVTRTSDSGQLMYRLSMATGYVSVALIAWAMMIGPWRVRRGRPAPASTDLRRDVGIWGGLFGLAHVLTGLQVHFGGKFWKYFLNPDSDHRIPVRVDLFGFANWTGLAAGLVLVLLLAISNDASLRALGTKRWKSWQRWTYGAAALTVAHALGYQIVADQEPRWVVLFALITVVVLAFQLDGRRRMLARASEREAAREPTPRAEPGVRPPPV